MSDTPETEKLPHYDDPPVVETVLGVQFTGLSGFTNAHLGAFWKTLDQSVWPTVIDAQSLIPQFEEFEEANRWSTGIHLQLSEDPGARLQIKNADQDKMMQLQKNRFHFNWIKQPPKAYPRYESVREGFEWAFARLTQYVAGDRLGIIKPNQWEVTYVNHIPRGTVWQTVADWTFFKLINQMSDFRGIASAESFSGEWHFTIPEQRGRLHIHWQHARGVSEEDEVRELVRLTLTARGPLKMKNEVETPASIIEGLNLGRATIVKSFRKLMSDDANRYWRLKNEATSGQP